MSMHKVPITHLEEEGLRKHGLPVGAPSQLSDVFRQGMAWQASQPKPAPVLLTEPELERLCVEDEFLLYCSQYEFNEIAKTVQQALLRKNGWGV